MIVRNALALGAGLTAFASSLSVAAETAAPATETSAAALSSEVVVTARRRTEALQDVPVAITAIGGAALADAEQIKTANDIVAFVPNASASATDGRTRPRWFLRGVGTNDTGANTVSPIGVYNDDVYINNVYLQGFPLFDIDHVEVLRGPQGTLWGKNTTGGAVHIVSRRPDFEDLGGEVELGAGNFDRRVANGWVNAPIVDGKLAARLSGSLDRRQGYVYNVYDGGTRGSLDDRAARLQVRAAPTEALDLNLRAHARTLQSDKRVSNYFPDLKQSPPYNFGYVDPLGRDVINQADDNAEENLDSGGGAFTATWSFGSGYELTSVSAYEQGRRVLTGGAAIPVPNLRTYAFARAEQWSEEVRLASPDEGRLDWILGAYWFKEDLEASTVEATTAIIPSGTPGFRARNWRDVAYTQDTTAYAIFANADFEFTDRLSVNAGARYSIEEKGIRLQVLNAVTPVSFNPNAPWFTREAVTSAVRTTYDQSDEDEWQELTYEITPKFEFTPDAHVYARFAHGFRAGGFAVSGQNTINPIDPEILDAYEVGAKTQWLDGALTINAAAFYYDYSDIQVLVFAQVAGSVDPVATLQNAGAGWVKGAELEARARLIEGLSVGLNVGLLETQYTQFNTVVNNAPKDASGNAFARAPRLSAGVNVDYSFDALGGEVRLGVDYNYRTKQYFNAAIQDNSLLEQNDYGVANARVAYRRDAWELAGSVQNIEDKDYTVLATGPTSRAVRRVSGDPRTFLVTIARSF